jgi:hypothetical protein
MASDNSTLPGCFSLGKPLPPNRCETCRYAGECRRFVRKDTLKEILVRLDQIEQKLRGER